MVDINTPDEALVDVAVIEALLQSGEHGGAPVDVAQMMMRHVEEGQDEPDSAEDEDADFVDATEE